MSRLLDNKLIFAAVFALFALACALNAIQGSGAPVHGQMLLADPVNVANGPIIPPDPWDGNVTVANGPIIPPDPWDGNVTIANGPIIPPDPWDGNVTIANGPIIPPDPWDGNLSVTA
jgi:hypothetical protein